MKRHSFITVGACALVLALALTTCVRAPAQKTDAQPQAQAHTTLVGSFHNDDLGNGWGVTESLELSYARRFTVDSYEGGYRLLCLADGSRYLVVPKGMLVPQGIANDIVVLQQPVGDIYLAASDTMCLLDALGALDKVRTAAVDLRRAEIMQMSCKSAVKGGDMLSASEVESLIRQMLDTGAPPTCPHGRPVMKVISRREMEKMFKRIQ